MTGRLRAAGRRLVTLAVRGRRDRGGEWGEALLAEFDQSAGTADVLRWTAGGLWVAWRERRTARRARVAALPRPVRLGRRLAATLAVLAALALVGQAFVATIVYEPSAGMSPTVRIGDRLLVDRVSFHVTGLHRGDLVVVRLTDDGRHYQALKRVVGLPGDRIECVDGVLHRNGAVVTEAYLAPGSRTDCAGTTLGAGQLFLLGDDRAVSRDSRDLGPVAGSAVVGRVLGTVWSG